MPIAFKVMRALVIIGLLFYTSFTRAQGPFAPNASTIGTTAIHKDSSILVNWAVGCTVTKGWQNIADTSFGLVTVGTESAAIGKPGANGIVSLGDKGEAILTFEHPIFDGVGADFAVFENSFSDDFLELAFVEVSSDGMNYFRFNTVSLTQDTTQIDAFGSIDATNIYNLAGKYRGQFGTPFDLSELANKSGLDVNNITHIKIIDVVGSIDSAYASYDSLGNAINDPFPTAFGSGGFDLDAVGIIHQFVGIEEIDFSTSIYPNPCNERVVIKCKNSNYEKSVSLFSFEGTLLETLQGMDTFEIKTDKYPPGLYFIQIKEFDQFVTKKLIIQ